MFSRNSGGSIRRMVGVATTSHLATRTHRQLAKASGISKRSHAASYCQTETLQHRVMVIVGTTKAIIEATAVWSQTLVSVIAMALVLAQAARATTTAYGQILARTQQQSSKHRRTAVVQPQQQQIAV